MAVDKNILEVQGLLDKVNTTLSEQITLYNTLAETTSKYGNNSNIKPSSFVGVSKEIGEINAKYLEQEKIIKSLQEKIINLSKSQTILVNSNTNLANGAKRVANNTREQSVANQILRAETDRNFRANTLLGGAYAKASAQLLVLKKEAKDYAIALGEMHPKTQQAVKDANDLGSRIKSADAVVGDFQRNVGNYSNGVVKGFQSIFSNVRQLAYILPGIGIAGIFGLIGEGIVKIFTKTSEALDKFKENVTDLVATTTEKASTLKTVSQVINDTKSSQEQFNYALKLAQQEGITLNAIEEARKGNLVLINKELTDQIDISIKKAKADKLVNLITENEIEQTKNLRKEKQDYESWYRKALRSLGKGSKDFALIEAGINKSSLSNIAELKRQNEEYYKMLKELGLENLLDEEKADGAKKERMRKSFAEAESLSNLRIAKLEEERLLQKEIQENENATDYGRLEARKEYSRLSLEILEEQFSKENALADLKYKEDLDKANEIYLKNKKNGFDDLQNAIEYRKAIADITNRYNNEKELSDIKYSKAFKENAYADAEFNEKLLKATFDKEEKYRKKTIEETDKLNSQINKSNQKKYQKIANDEEKTLKARQLAFDEYKNLALAELNIEQQKELAKADPLEYDVIIQKYKDLKEGIEGLESPLDKANKKTQQFLNSFQSDFINKGLESIGASSLKIFLDIDSNGQSTFDKLREAAKETKDEWKVTFQAVTEIAQDAFNIISEISNRRFQEEYNSLEKQKNIALAFAGDSETAKAEIERQAEQRRKDIAKREFKAKQQQAIANIAIDTAQAIMATLGKTGFFGIPLTFVVAALGAAQIALVASQKMPEFWKGTDNAPEGYAWTQEKGAEVITDKNNRVKTLGSNKGAILTKLSAGDKVYTAEKSKQLMFDDAFNQVVFNSNLSNMMQSSGVSMSNEKQPIIMLDTQSIVSAIENKQELHQYFDHNGYRSHIQNGHSTKQLLNSQVKFKSQSV